jgi:hypothetical protein
MLRKMGIQARDYNLFIETLEDGTFVCQVAKAEMHLASLKNPIMAEVGNPAPETDQVPAASKAKRAGRRKAGPVIQAEEPKAKRGGVSAVARELILAGKTNQEVWAVLKETFGLDDSKKYYPGWYRCEMKRKGLIRE